MRVHSRTVVESVIVAVIAVFSAIMLTLATSIQAAISLSAGTALIVPGTGTSNPANSANYMDNAVTYFVVPSCGTTCPAGGYTPTAVPYTAQFWPFPFAGWGGLQGAKWDASVQSGVVSLSMIYGETTQTTGDPITAFGYSQGATVVSIFKRNLAILKGGTIPAGTFFTLIGNPNRPNGGLFERLAILGTLPIVDATFGQPTPTDTAPEGLTNTTDTVFQYDGIGDMASNILNVPAVLNGLLGFWYVHGTYLDPRGRPPNNVVSGELAYGYTAQQIEGMVAGCTADPSGANCQQHGDTIYVTIPATSLPIVQPFIDLGAATHTSALINPIIALVQPALQTVIEAGYDRRNYGSPTPFQLIPRVDPIKFVSDLIQDVPEGFNAAVATIKDPNHKIPDLPPIWGTGSSAATTPAAGTTELNPEPTLAPAELTAEPAEPAEPRLRDLTPATDAVASTTPATRTHLHAVRDLTGAAKADLGSRAGGVEKAKKAQHAKKTAQAPASADKPAA